MATKAISWLTNYRACFGAIQDKQADAWTDYLASNLENGLQASELDRAVAGMCDDWPADAKRHPGVRDILKAIKAQRLRARGIDTSKPFPVRQAEAQIHRTTTETLARWEIICGIDGLRHKGEIAGDWAPHLEAYAFSTGGLTVPYWAATEARVSRGARVVGKAEYVAALPPDMQEAYRRMAGASVASIAAGMRCVLQDDGQQAAQ